MAKDREAYIRELALAHYKKYKSTKDTCEDFRISRSSLFRWLKLKKSGDIKPKKRGGRRKSKITAKHLNEAYEKAKGVSQTELAKAIGISQPTVSRALKKHKRDLWTVMRRKISKSRNSVSK